MKNYTLTSFLLPIWLFMTLTVIDIFQENAIHPHTKFTPFNFCFVCAFCLFSGIMFKTYKRKY